MSLPPPQDPTPNDPFPTGNGHGKGPERHEGNGRLPGKGNGRTPENHSHHPPALKRTVVRPVGTIPDPIDSAYVANRLTTLTHELSTLLDGSLRVIGLAKRSLAGGIEHSDRPSSRRDICPEQLVRHLDTVDAAMRQMVELVRSTMVGMAEGGTAGVRDSFGSSSSLADAVRHAVEVMTPAAEECCVQIDAQIDPDLNDIAAGPIYAVITNGVRNAIESIQRVGDKFVGGRVLVRAWTQAGKTGRCVMITIEDDGEGLITPTNGHSRRDNTRNHRTKPATENSPFQLGFTTKPGGSGIGLSLSRDVIEQLGGTIDLVARAKDPHSGRAGATLNVCYPVPTRRVAG